MRANDVFEECRKHLRATLNNAVVGILSSHAPETVGTIADISLGGAKCIYQGSRVVSAEKNFRHSIDLIAGSHYVFDIPCDCAWNNRISSGEPGAEFSCLKEYGIRFGELTPWQLFQLRGIIEPILSSAEGITGKKPRV